MNSIRETPYFLNAALFDKQHMYALNMLTLALTTIVWNNVNTSRRHPVFYRKLHFQIADYRYKDKAQDTRPKISLSEGLILTTRVF